LNGGRHHTSQGIGVGDGGGVVRIVGVVGGFVGGGIYLQYLPWIHEVGAIQ